MTPVIVGVADVKNSSTAVEDAKEPAQLMLEAIDLALQDTSSRDGQQLKSGIDSVDVVHTWTWPYADLPGLLSKKLGVQPRHKGYTDIGGNQPARLLDEAAVRISSGESKIAVITGGEALASLSSCVKNKQLPPPGWTEPAQMVESVFSPTTRKLTKDDIGGIHSVGSPIHVYPLYENGLRAHLKQSIKENHDESAEMYAQFSQVAAQHMYAWNYGKPADTKEIIGTVSPKNRMICFPYPLLMNAFNTVNLAAACILTSTDEAKRLEIPESKWIYPRSGAGEKDADRFWERPNYYSTPAISWSLDQALRTSGLTRDDIDIFDFYSCFPIVPKLACHHLGLSITNPAKPITVLGGLTSFGGAGNNYSMHAITEMTRLLRSGKGRNALILANGGVLSYQHVVCLSSQPNKGAYPDNRALKIANKPKPMVSAEAEGEAVIETYTVEFSRKGTPSRAFVIGRLKNGHRFVANHGDVPTLMRLSSVTEEPIGKTGFVKSVKTEGGLSKNLFFFDSAKL